MPVSKEMSKDNLRRHTEIAHKGTNMLTFQCKQMSPEKQHNIQSWVQDISETGGATFGDLLTTNCRTTTVTNARVESGQSLQNIPENFELKTIQPLVDPVPVNTPQADYDPDYQTLDYHKKSPRINTWTNPFSDVESRDGAVHKSKHHERMKAESVNNEHTIITKDNRGGDSNNKPIHLFKAGSQQRAQDGLSPVPSSMTTRQSNNNSKNQTKWASASPERVSFASDTSSEMQAISYKLAEISLHYAAQRDREANQSKRQKIVPPRTTTKLRFLTERDFEDDDEDEGTVEGSTKDKASQRNCARSRMSSAGRSTLSSRATTASPAKRPKSKVGIRSTSNELLNYRSIDECKLKHRYRPNRVIETPKSAPNDRRSARGSRHSQHLGSSELTNQGSKFNSSASTDFDIRRGDNINKGQNKVVTYGFDTLIHDKDVMNNLAKKGLYRFEKSCHRSLPESKESETFQKRHQLLRNYIESAIKIKEDTKMHNYYLRSHHFYNKSHPGSACSTGSDIPNSENLHSRHSKGVIQEGMLLDDMSRSCDIVRSPTRASTSFLKSLVGDMESGSVIVE